MISDLKRAHEGGQSCMPLETLPRVNPALLLYNVSCVSHKHILRSTMPTLLVLQRYRGINPTEGENEEEIDFFFPSLFKG